METSIATVTDRQRSRLKQLLLSSVFTPEEAASATAWLKSPQATKEKASTLIDRALSRIKKRDQAKKASADRRAEYHANKDNGGGEYPPKRYSNENPPPNENSTKENPPVPAPVPQAEQEQKIYRINGRDYTDKNEAAAAASKAIFG